MGLQQARISMKAGSDLLEIRRLAMEAQQAIIERQADHLEAALEQMADRLVELREYVAQRPLF